MSFMLVAYKPSSADYCRGPDAIYLLSRIKEAQALVKILKKLWHREEK